MKQYKLTIFYDGTDFAGWLQQPDKPSIVQALQDSFFTVFKKQIRLLGASKTDAGVHALGQVAIFKTDLSLDAQTMHWAWNKALPESIQIIALEHDEQFHPHYNVHEKIYWYHVSRNKLSPFVARFGWRYPLPFGEQKLNEALQLFIGTHDFEHFYKGEDRDNTIRTINDISVILLPEYNAYRIEIRGEKFLRHMVRRIVGAALHVASDKATSQDIQNALQKIKSKNLPTAPAKGLMLYKIKFHN